MCTDYIRLVNQGEHETEAIHIACEGMHGHYANTLHEWIASVEKARDKVGLNLPIDTFDDTAWS